MSAGASRRHQQLERNLEFVQVGKLLLQTVELLLVGVLVAYGHDVLFTGRHELFQFTRHDIQSLLVLGTHSLCFFTSIQRPFSFTHS